jgi:hypothetical protein
MKSTHNFLPKNGKPILKNGKPKSGIGKLQ